MRAESQRRRFLRRRPAHHRALRSRHPSATDDAGGDPGVRRRRAPGARHRLRFTVAAGAVLEYRPKTVIPQSDSTFTQRLDLDIAARRDLPRLGGRGRGPDRTRRAFPVRPLRQRVRGRDRRAGRGPGPTGVPADKHGSGERSSAATTPLPSWRTPGRSPARSVLQRVRAILDELSGLLGGAGELPGGQRGFRADHHARRAPDLHRAPQALHDAARDRTAILRNEYGRSA